MVWDLAWWGNSSDGNKVRAMYSLSLPIPLYPSIGRRGAEKTKNVDISCRSSCSSIATPNSAKIGS